ncbi:nuclear transport factor 2 family protein [Zhouia amylolytica]|nr:nuclear transport factor 2 family protein [Zhouia amylolytica]
MKESKRLVMEWFSKWSSGDFTNLPISANFSHTSPFGTIEGKQGYIDLVAANKDKFLGYTFSIIDGVYEQDKACVRYKAVQGDFELEVSEWYYFKEACIDKIVAYYHIGDIREDRKLQP